jgi:hypothetical protein
MTDLPGQIQPVWFNNIDAASLHVTVNDNDRVGLVITYLPLTGDEPMDDDGVRNVTPAGLITMDLLQAAELGDALHHRANQAWTPSGSAKRISPVRFGGNTAFLSVARAPSAEFLEAEGITDPLPPHLRAGRQLGIVIMKPQDPEPGCRFAANHPVGVLAMTLSQGDELADQLRLAIN